MRLHVPICSLVLVILLSLVERSTADACDINNGGCDHYCYVGFFSGILSCSCYLSAELQDDGFSCLCKEDYYTNTQWQMCSQCKYSDWSDWSTECSVPCGEGHLVQNRTVTKGTDAECTDTGNEKSCNNGMCTTTISIELPTSIVPSTQTSIPDITSTDFATPTSPVCPQCSEHGVCTSEGLCVCTEGFYGDGMDCKQCSDCDIGEYIVQKCNSACREGYYIENGYCKDCRQAVPENYKCDLALPVICNGTSDFICTGCQSGWANANLTEFGQCDELDQCADQEAKNCLSCNKGQCTSCKDGYTDTATHCIEECGKTSNTILSNCLDHDCSHEIAGYGQPSCTRCNRGFYRKLKQGLYTCEECIGGCSIGSYLSNECSGQSTNDTATCTDCSVSSCPSGQYIAGCDGSMTSDSSKCLPCLTDCKSMQILDGSCSGSTFKDSTKCEDVGAITFISNYCADYLANVDAFNANFTMLIVAQDYNSLKIVGDTCVEARDDKSSRSTPRRQAETGAGLKIDGNDADLAGFTNDVAIGASYTNDLGITAVMISNGSIVYHGSVSSAPLESEDEEIGKSAIIALAVGISAAVLIVVLAVLFIWRRKFVRLKSLDGNNNFTDSSSSIGTQFLESTQQLARIASPLPSPPSAMTMRFRDGGFARAERDGFPMSQSDQPAEKRSTGDDSAKVLQFGAHTVSLQEARASSLPSTSVREVPPSAGMDPQSIAVVQLIGAGSFSTAVYEGMLYRPTMIRPYQPVAITQLFRGLASSATDEDKERVRRDIDDVTDLLGLAHPNCVQVVGLFYGALGACVVTELMLGSVHYVLTNRKEYNTSTCLSERAWMAYQIAQGMAFLSKNNIVHKNLRATNCLLTYPDSTSYGNPVVKITNYGLTAPILEYALSDVNPVRWDAPELLVQSTRTPTTQTDVWAYGVTMWEVFGDGTQPYSDVPLRMRFKEDLGTYVNEGKRLKRPADCPEEFFAIMLSCWEAVPDSRLSFYDITMRTGSLFANHCEADVHVQMYDGDARLFYSLKTAKTEGQYENVDRSGSEDLYQNLQTLSSDKIYENAPDLL
eukprot:CFRG1156T1